MVNRPFMVGPQSLLSWANSSCPAWRDGEGGGALWRLLWRWESPVFCVVVFFSPLCITVQGGARVKDHQTKTLAELKMLANSITTLGKTPTVNDARTK